MRVGANQTATEQKKPPATPGSVNRQRRMEGRRVLHNHRGELDPRAWATASSRWGRRGEFWGPYRKHGIKPRDRALQHIADVHCSKYRYINTNFLVWIASMGSQSPKCCSYRQRGGTSTPFASMPNETKHPSLETSWSSLRPRATDACLHDITRLQASPCTLRSCMLP